MGQLNFVQRLQIANQKGCSDVDTGRTSLFLSQKYLTLLRMRRTNVPQIAVLNDRAVCQEACNITARETALCK